MANWSRALLNLGEGLGMMASNVAQRERDEAMALREENLMRLQARLREQSAQAEREFADRQGAVQHERNLVELGVRGSMDLQAGAQQFEQTKELAGIEFGQRKELMRMEQSALDKRVGRDDAGAIQSAYAKQFEKIDERMQQINDNRIKAAQEAATSGIDMDPTLLAPWDQELMQLRKQREALEVSMYEELAEKGAPGFRKLSAAEVAELEKRRQPPPAAQQAAPADVPRPPPKPPRMIEREQRKESRAGRAIVENARAASAIPEPVRSGAKKALSTAATYARDIFGPEPAAITALKSGKPLSEPQIKQLRSMGRERVKVYGVSDAQLKKVF